MFERGGQVGVEGECPVLDLLDGVPMPHAFQPGRRAERDGAAKPVERRQRWRVL